MEHDLIVTHFSNLPTGLYLSTSIIVQQLAHVTCNKVVKMIYMMESIIHAYIY